MSENYIQFPFWKEMQKMAVSSLFDLQSSP